MDFTELRLALVETMKEASRFILDKDLKQFSSATDLYHAPKSLDDQTKEVDSLALKLIIEKLRSYLPGTKALLVSEENPIGEPLSSTTGLPELIFLIDPIDNTDGAIHGAVPFSAISVYSRTTNSVIAAAVADPALRQIYYADEETPAAGYPLHAKPGDDASIPLTPTKKSEIEGAYLCIYTLKPARLLLVSKAEKLLTALGASGRVECLGGAVSLCRVAAGYVDAAVEFAKGFQAYDLFPGAYILQQAGGICAKPDGMKRVELRLNFSHQAEIKDAVRQRRLFIGTGTNELCASIASSLLKDGIAFDNVPLAQAPSE